MTSDSAWRISSADWNRSSRAGASARISSLSSVGVIQGAFADGVCGARVAHQRHRGRRIQVRELQVLVPGQQLPQHDAQAVDVGARVGDLAARLLGREVRRAPEHHAGRGVLLLEHAARQPEVGQLHLAEVAEQDVGRRDVAVDQVQVAVAVDVGERAGDLAADVQRDVERDAGPRAHAAVPDLAQVLALDQLHRDEELAVDLAGVEGRHQVGVRQAQHDLGLVEEPVAPSRDRVFSAIIFLMTQNFWKPASPVAAR